MFLFALGTPLGILTGAAIGGGELLDVIMNSLCAGTFTYVSLSHVIVEEFTIPGDRFWKLLAYFVGISIIFSLWFIPGS